MIKTINIHNPVSLEKKQQQSNRTQSSTNSDNTDDFYMINVYAAKTENEAKRRVSELKNEGYQSSYLWIPDYMSLTDAKFYSVYIGPFKTIEQCAVATENYRKKNATAYGLLVSNKNKRVEIRSRTDIKTIEPYK